MLRRAAVTIAITAAVCGIASVSAAAPASENTQDIDTVQVATSSGPALWHVTRGNSEVWILSSPGGVSREISWNKEYLADLLDGARAIIMQPVSSVGVFEGAWFLITDGGKLSLPRGQTLEPSLSSDLRDRFATARTAIGRDASRYETDTPLRAAIRLEGDFFRNASLSGSAIDDTVRDLADDKDIPNTPVANYQVLDAAKDALTLDFAQQSACLDAAVDDVNWQLLHAKLAGEAWSKGDVKTLQANYQPSRLFDCIAAAVPSIRVLSERNVADYTAAIDAALNQPGKTIAVVNIFTLTREGGVLERLKSPDTMIEAPSDWR